MSRFYESVMIVRGLSPFLKVYQQNACEDLWSGKVTLGHPRSP